MNSTNQENQAKLSLLHDKVSDLQAQMQEVLIEITTELIKLNDVPNFIEVDFIEVPKRGRGRPKKTKHHVSDDVLSL